MKRLCFELLLYSCLLALCFGCEDLAHPQEPVWNKQPCAHCHMLVSDPRFAAQLVTRSHEWLYFDDPGCLADYMRAHPQDVERAWVWDGVAWSDPQRVRFIAGASSPMGYGFAPSTAGEHDFAAVTRAANARHKQGAP